MFNVDDYAYSIRYECIIVSLTWYLIDFIKGLFLIINPSDNIILFNKFSTKKWVSFYAFINCTKHFLIIMISTFGNFY